MRRLNAALRPFRFICIALFFVIHAFLVIDCGLNLGHLNNSFPGFSALKTYGSIIRLYTIYPFFGPYIREEHILTLRAQDGATQIVERTNEEWSTEARNRLEGAIEHLDNYQADDALGKTFAADFFARQRCVRNVDVALSVYHLPTMSDYRAGQGAHEVILYEAVFTRKREDPTCAT
jgi:hypothetical protein